MVSLSNSMKSSNPHSGCREVETSKTIDTTTPEPSKNQGGIAIAQPSHAFKVRGGCEGGGKGYLGQDEKAFTISAMQDQQVAQPIAAHKVSPTITAKMQGMSGWAPYNETEHLVPVTQPIAVDTYNYTTNEKTTQTIRSQSDTEHIGAVLEPTIIDRAAFNQDQNAQYEPRIEEGQTMPSLVAKGPHAVANPKVFDWQSGGDARGLDLKDTAQLQRCQTPALLHTMAIRRLTPKECERLQSVYEVVKEIRVRKYDVDVEYLKKILKNHKNQSNKKIANALNLPKTLVDHWFRTDRSFAIPDPESWIKLKSLLNITDNTLDKSIMEFEYKDNEYDSSNRIYDSSFVSPTLTSANSGSDNYLHTMAIRRLTPKECERLQGFPDDWTKIPYRNKPADQCPDGPRYKACGNSMAVPVMRWIGERIQMIENYLNQ